MKGDEHDHEKIYDEQIAPLMTQIIRICQKHELPMFATFEYSSRQYCTTHLPFGTGSLFIRMCSWVQACDRGENGVDVDSFISATLSYSKQNPPHSSVYLRLLGLREDGTDHQE